MIYSNWKDIDIKSKVKQGRVLCLDYGLKRTGVAISDSGWEIATPLIVIETNLLLQKLQLILNEYKVGLFIIGVPIALNGGINGIQHSIVNDFTSKLNNTFNIDILQYDERLSTVAANRFLTESNMNWRKKKNNIDKVAASFILQGLLDTINYQLDAIV